MGWRIEESFNNKSGMLTTASVATAVNTNTPSEASPMSSAASSASTTTDPLAPQVIGDNIASALALEYSTLKSSGTYSTSTAEQVARSMGATIKADVPFEAYVASDIKTVPDTSQAAMLAYRAQLQVALKPLMRNTASEVDLLTKYEETKDPSYLSELKQASANYKLAASSSAQIAVPADAVTVQLGILNAMQEFSATIDQMIASSDDALTEATLINTFLDSQQHMTSSFNDLYTYWKSKQS